MPRLSIVVPAFNEEQRLPPTLDRIRRFVDASEEWRGAEIAVVDDGSTDRTAQVVSEFASRTPGVRLLQNPGNRGKGYSVRHGMLEAAGDLILSTDADLSAPIEELDRLAAELARRDAQVAIGSRAIDRKMIERHQPVMREYSGRFFNLVMRSLTGLPFRDTQCGFKLFRREAARNIFSRQRLDGFGFDVEDLFIAKLLGLTVVEVPVRWSNVEGSKVTLLHGVNAFGDIVRVRKNQFLGRYSTNDS